MSDTGPMSTKQLDQLASDESKRKTAKNLRAEKKGEGQEYCLAKENNGDIIKWNRIGAAMTKEGERYAVAIKKPHQVAEMLAVSSWSSDLKQPVRKARKDFAGNGNIITWM